MKQPRKQQARSRPAKVVDFDEILLGACAPQARAALMVEAEMLAAAFAPNRDSDVLKRLAAHLASGERDAEMDRAHAHRLAAALRRLAKPA
jgi:hypothetical protein